jgi:hypothetical protein
MADVLRDALVRVASKSETSLPSNISKRQRESFYPQGRLIADAREKPQHDDAKMTVFCRQNRTGADSKRYNFVCRKRSCLRSKQQIKTGRVFGSTCLTS